MPELSVVVPDLPIWKYEFDVRFVEEDVISVDFKQKPFIINSEIPQILVE